MYGRGPTNRSERLVHFFSCSGKSVLFHQMFCTTKTIQNRGKLSVEYFLGTTKCVLTLPSVCAASALNDQLPDEFVTPVLDVGNVRIRWSHMRESSPLGIDFVCVCALRKVPNQIQLQVEDACPPWGTHTPALLWGVGGGPLSNKREENARATGR